MIATGTQTTNQFFSKLNSDGGFGDCQGLRIRVHCDKFYSSYSVSDHTGNCIGSTTAKPDNFNSYGTRGKI
jgi:hypothetical protein